MYINNNAYNNILQRMQTPSNDVNALNDGADKSKDVSKNNVSSTTVPQNMDKVDLGKGSTVTETTDKNPVDKPKFEWKYNTTDNGYLPDFKLGEWEKTSEALFGGNTMTVDERTYAVFLPKSVQDKMEKDPEFAKSIHAKIEDFFEAAKREGGKAEDGSEVSIVSQHMAIAFNENGDIMHTYVRTESYTTKGQMPDKPANDENANGNKVEEQINKDNSLASGIEAYGKQSSIFNKDKKDDKELKSQDQVAKFLENLGITNVETVETAQVLGFEPETKIRKANGDVVSLETGRLIQKHSEYAASLLKYDAKA